MADAIGALLIREGWPRYTNHPDDNGGPTKGGITLATLSKWRKRPCTAADVEALTIDEVRAIYEHEYVAKPGFNRIRDRDLRELVIDCGVLHGVDDADAWLRAAMGWQPGRAMDWDAVNRADPHSVALRICVSRIRYMGQIITANWRQRKAGKTQRDQAAHAHGWLNRATEFVLVEIERGQTS